MSGVVSGFQKFFTKDRVVIFLVFGVLVFFLISYSGLKYNFGDSMDTGYPMQQQGPPMQQQGPPMPMPEKKEQMQAPVQDKMRNVASPGDLLPSDQNSQWASLNPGNNGNQMPDLLQAGYHIGLDTIGQTMKNPNLQLRSDPIIPKQSVGPWNQSTIDPDLLRVPLEVGVAP